VGDTLERRRGHDRRERERRAAVASIQADQNELRRQLRENMDKIRRLEADQLTQLVRIAQIQHEIDQLKKSRT
jgi:hypothetical protein